MEKWLRALLSEWGFAIWWILSAISTLTTFFLPGMSGRWGLGFAISTGVGFGWANFRVFQKQQSRLSALEQQVATVELRRSNLRIMPDERSRYILQPVDNIRRADFNGGYFEFRLMIENAGTRNSTINNYAVEIVELRRRFDNLQSLEGRSGAQGRHSHQGLSPATILSRNGIIQIDAERATGHGTLVFFLPGINMDAFFHAGVNMQGEERRYGSLHCRLTLTDTSGSSATEDFELTES